ncbi:hypothetical protein [Brevundimonas sp.]|uniref:hypothetical protein n=1 Tax=Brevundimonas sp. TaxID=1871086 RepID=UPI00391929C9
MGGDEEPRPRRARRRAATASQPTTPDPVEIAMETLASGQAPSSSAERLLENQNRLIQEQIGLARNERFRARIKAARDGALAVGAAAVLFGAGWFVWDASQARGLVVHAFSVPPDLAERGFTGEVAAQRFLDKTAPIQALSNSARPPESFQDNWVDNVSLEIPTTGISLEQASAWLRKRLGRETHVRGEIVRQGGQLVLTVRAGRDAAPARTGTDADLDSMMQGAAEDVFRLKQPYLFANYLRSDPARRAEIDALFIDLVQDRSALERGWAYLGRGVVKAIDSGDLRGGLADELLAVKVMPELALAWVNAGGFAHDLGRAEQGYQLTRRGLEVYRRDGARTMEREAAQVVVTRAEALTARWRGDALGEIEAWDRFADLVPYAGWRAVAPYAAAEAMARNHDATGARRRMADLPLQDPGQVFLMNRGTRGLSRLPTLAIAAAVDDWAEVERQGLALDATLKGEPPYAEVRAVLVWPSIARAWAEQGRFEAAERLMSWAPADCWPCLRTQARIAALQGDASRADRLYAEAVRQGPSLPFAYAEWAEAKLRRGDAAGALPLLAEARERGPRWADPLKLEGDALARLGRDRDAVRRYADAAERAPRWGALHLAWGDALNRLGRRDEAIAKWRLAAGMDLSARERAVVTQRLSRR